MERDQSTISLADRGMTAVEFVRKHNLDMNTIHGNIGDHREGNLLIEIQSGRDCGKWEFWNKNRNLTIHELSELTGVL